jgi:hypothetical protein
MVGSGWFLESNSDKISSASLDLLGSLNLKFL